MRNVHSALVSLAAGVCVLAGSAMAQDAMECALSYDVYEESVPHTDLENCPESMAEEGKFCRLSVVAEVATIFAFDEESGCLLEAKSFYEDEFTITIE